MARTLRELLSETLIDSASEIALDRQEMQRRLEAVPTQARGRDGALASLQIAGLFESATLWIGWRLQPRHFGRVEQHHI